MRAVAKKAQVSVATVSRTINRVPTVAIMCSNDLTAIGVLHKSHQVGLRIPQDMSIIGFDDIQMVRMMIPPLASIHMSRINLANVAMKALIGHIEGKSPPREYKIDTHLVVRESSSFPPGAVCGSKTRHGSSARPACDHT
jgi:LacI family transcriptional regulator